MRWNKNLGIFLFLILICLTGCVSGESVMNADDCTDSGVEDFIADQSTEKDQEEETSIYVYVCGYVEHPGVYQLTTDSRICDALVLAGGISEGGRAEALNQAEHMQDGQTIYVPGIEEPVQGEQDSEKDGLLNINTATQEDLMLLPGIGQAKADKILQYREEHGSFQSIDELMEIDGIKEGVFNKVKTQIKV